MAIARSRKVKSQDHRKKGYQDQQIARLNVKQQLFVNALLADVTMAPGTAALEAGYETAAAAHHLMKNPIINRLISIKQMEREERLEIKSDAVLTYLYHALQNDPLETFTVLGDGTVALKALDDIPIEIRRLMTKIKTKTRTTLEGTETTVEVEWVSKELALQLSMRHLGLLNDKIAVEHSGPADIMIQLRDAMDNASSRLITDKTIDGTVRLSQ